MNRSGKKTEEIYSICLITGKDVSSITNQYNDFGIKIIDKFISDVKRAENKGERILYIHNHPRGIVPSIADFRKILNYKYACGITVGDNGSVYYSKSNRDLDMSDLNVALLKNKSYNLSEKYEEVMICLAT